MQKTLLKNNLQSLPRKGQTFSPVVLVYGYFTDDNGDVQFGQVSEENIYDKIQSYADSCDMDFVKQMILDGECPAPAISDDAFFDTTVFPDNLIDAMDGIKSASIAFNSLPFELRKKYNNNVYEFAKKFDFSILQKKEINEDVKVAADKSPVETGD